MGTYWSTYDLLGPFFYFLGHRKYSTVLPGEQDTAAFGSMAFTNG